eukprot:CAMPEP_0178487432 /NCGR_PEP_ID=MMETSP0696-20121128/9321_1 /TAXON_ID=265572 /ORGANISM="Extubocellulus spinifer, Strain CCMP396" /LENGTH=539 /DNA_ID=CAMNT_0020115129 /DNA_START=39 /DNA_END=1658 /DNA_ORIENTATION=+
MASSPYAQQQPGAPGGAAGIPPPPSPAGSMSDPTSYANYPPPSSASPSQPLPTATPTLKVMRLQAPQLGQPNAGSLGPACLLGPSCTLPDTFGVIHIGETFTAYLGVLNADADLPIRSLTVTAQLQTPSRRWPLPCGLEGGSSSSDRDGAAGGTSTDDDDPMGPLDVQPGTGVDSIVSRPLEEVGQHILRVEVAYGSGPTSRTLRKFYRFNVSSPLHIRELTVRAGDDRCYVSIAVENASSAGAGTGGGGLTISAADFHPPVGLVAERVGGGVGGGFGIVAADGSDHTDCTKTMSAVSLYETSGRLEPGESYRYLFLVRAASEDAALRGIACGDELGKAVFAWRKAMGETGRIASASVRCPPAQPPGLVSEDGTTSVVAASSKFVVHRSGLSVDAAAAAANRMARDQAPSQQQGGASLDKILPVTVEPIDPPSHLELGKPVEIKLLVVNHSSEPMRLQLQMRLAQMSGVVVCGLSFKNLGEVSPSGGSSVVDVRVVALVTGLFYVQGCSVVDLTTGREVAQPPLFNVFVERRDGNRLEQ